MYRCSWSLQMILSLRWRLMSYVLGWSSSSFWSSVSRSLAACLKCQWMELQVSHLCLHRFWLVGLGLQVRVLGVLRFRRGSRILSLSRVFARIVTASWALVVARARARGAFIDYQEKVIGFTVALLRVNDDDGHWFRSERFIRSPLVWSWATVDLSSNLCNCNCCVFSTARAKTDINHSTRRARVPWYGVFAPNSPLIPRLRARESGFCHGKAQGKSWKKRVTHYRNVDSLLLIDSRNYWIRFECLEAGCE